MKNVFLNIDESEILNAKSFEKQGFSVVLEEDGATGQDLSNKVNELYANKDKYVEAMKSSNFSGGVDAIIETILEKAK